MAKNIRHIYDHIIEETNDQQEETLQHKDDRTETEEDEYEEPCSERTAAQKRPADGALVTPNPPKKSKISSSTSSLTPESASKTSTSPISGAGTGVSIPGNAKQPWRSAREDDLSDAQAIRIRELEDEIVDPNRELSTERASEIAKEMFRGIFMLSTPPVSVILDMRRVHIEPQGRYSIQAELQKSNIGLARWECAPVMAWMKTILPEEERMRVNCWFEAAEMLKEAEELQPRVRELKQRALERPADIKGTFDPGWKDALEAAEETIARCEELPALPARAPVPTFEHNLKQFRELNEELAKKFPGMF